LLQTGQDNTTLTTVLALILFIIVGIGVAFFSSQNTQTVSITFANYPLTDVPLYQIVLSFLLIGLFLGWIISFFNVITSAFKIHRKENTIQDAKKQISLLTKKIHQLELENERLKNEYDLPSDDKSM
jgi:uncharacterized integral membrane protein